MDILLFFISVKSVKSCLKNYLEKTKYLTLPRRHERLKARNIFYSFRRFSCLLNFHNFVVALNIEIPIHQVSPPKAGTLFNAEDAEILHKESPLSFLFSYSFSAFSAICCFRYSCYAVFYIL